MSNDVSFSTGNSSEGNIVISADNIPFSAYQAIYHKLTRRVEKINKRFNEAYDIHPEDIKNLSERIEQSIVNYPIAGKRCEITHSLKDGEVHTYSSVDRFLLSNKTSREFTSDLGFEFDFLISTPQSVEQAKDISQRYKVRLVFERTVFEKDDPKIPFFMRGFIGKSELSLNLEYTDYAIAQQLEAVVSNWVKSLPTRKVGKISKVINWLEEPARHYLPVAAQAVPILVGAAHIATSQPSIKASSFIILISYILGNISAIVTSHFMDKFYNASRALIPCASVHITLGDQEYNKRNSETLSKTTNTLAFFLLVIAVPFIINLSSSIVYERMFKGG